MKINEVIEEIKKAAPLELQLDYDNSGLQVGDIGQKLGNVMVALDVGLETVMRAVKKKANLIISHHPLIFKAMKRIAPDSHTGRTIITAIKNDICIYACHTNFDFACGGLNDILGSLLDIDNMAPLVNHEDSTHCKLVIFAPEGYEQKIKKALFSIGAGNIGAYSRCSFSQNGEGTFAAPKEADPFTGRKGRDNTVSETRIEMIIPKNIISRAVSEIRHAHPYEEPAYDVYPLVGTDARAGMGRIGELKNETLLFELCKAVKEKLKIRHLRFVGNETARVKKVAICTGSGGSLMKAAENAGADVYITGDIKYHEAKQAQSDGFNIIDAGHFSTEVIFMDFIKNYLKEFLRKKSSGLKVFTDNAEDPFAIM